MISIIKKLFLFILLNSLVLIAVTMLIGTVFSYKAWEQDSDVFVIPSNHEYDLLIMGTSHADFFSRYQNHLIVEEILGISFFNLAQPGSGPFMERIYLEYFFEKNNKSEQIIYFIDPYALYSDKWNQNYALLAYGKFEPSFFLKLIRNNVSHRTIFNYLKTYISLKWFIKNPKKSEPDSRVVDVSSAALLKRLNDLYPEGTSEETYTKYIKDLDSILYSAQKKNIEVIFIIPPTLIQTLPGKDMLLKSLENYHLKYNVKYYDYSNTLQDPKYFSDVDHLNSKGVRIFTENFLRDLLS